MAGSDAAQLRMPIGGVAARPPTPVNDWLLEQAPTARVQVPEVSAETLRRARRVQDRYASLRLDLTDAVNVVLAEAYETSAVLTLDRRDFRAVPPLTEHEGFLLLPDDM